MQAVLGRKLTRRGPWRFKLYIAGLSGRSLTAVANLKELCAERLAGNCEIQVIDLLQNPELARADQIVVLPTLVRVGPGLVRRVVGDLSNSKRVLEGLHLTPV